jgi:hypothetical protein
MNTTCPRCGTIILASQEARRFTCPTCQVRYCRQCQSWKERGQKYCLDCALNFLSPPSAIHVSVKQSAWLAMLFVVVIALFYPVWSPWYGLCYSLVALGFYFTAYLVRFQRHTSLTWATRREALVVVRQAIIWSSLAYFLIRLGRSEAFVVLLIGTALATGLGLLIINRLNPIVVDELRANRAAWKAVLAMKATDAMFMRFPAASRG